jgi:hypothetical protein
MSNLNAIQNLFEKMEKKYSSISHQAKIIKGLLTKRGETVINDHIALRTVSLPKVKLEVLAQVFLDLGYEEKDSYIFVKKKLRAKHYEHPDNFPKVFISELQLDQCSEFLQKTVKDCIDSGDFNTPESLVIDAKWWNPLKYETYEKILNESEYASWLLTIGYCVNHFTIYINSLNTVSGIEDLNKLLELSGFILNTAGSKIKGSEQQGLKQSSTKASMTKSTMISAEGEEKEFWVPGCYYEFAERFEKDGKLFNGFITESADKIFESTNIYRR